MDTNSLAAKIDKMTDEELETFVASIKFECKVDKTGTMSCITSEDEARAVARLKKQPSRLVFEITPETPPVAPATES